MLTALFNTTRRWSILFCYLLCTVWLLGASAWADTRAEMCKQLDNLAQGGAAGEAAIDWESFEFHSPKLQGIDFRKEYNKRNATEKAQLRRDFVKGFSTPFKAASNGGTFAKASNRPGVKILNEKSNSPSIEFPAAAGQKFVVGFVRKKSGLKISKLSVR